MKWSWMLIYFYENNSIKEPLEGDFKSIKLLEGIYGISTWKSDKR